MRFPIYDIRHFSFCAILKSTHHSHHFGNGPNLFRINKEKDVLPNNSLTYDVQYVPNEDSFRTTKKVNIGSFIFSWAFKYIIKIAIKYL